MVKKLAWITLIDESALHVQPGDSLALQFKTEKIIVIELMSYGCLYKDYNGTIHFSISKIWRGFTVVSSFHYEWGKSDQMKQWFVCFLAFIARKVLWNNLENWGKAFFNHPENRSVLNKLFISTSLLFREVIAPNNETAWQLWRQFQILFRFSDSFHNNEHSVISRCFELLCPAPISWKGGKQWSKAVF